MSDPQETATDFRRGKKASRRVATVLPDEYAAYIRSSEWEQKKRKYRASRLPQGCVVCDCHQVDLHHRSYKRLGNEYLTDLIPLCRAHHRDLHAYHREIGGDLWRATARFIRGNGRTLRGRNRKRTRARKGLAA